MGKEVKLIRDQDPCDPPAESEPECKCELVCKCMKIGKTYQTSTEICDDYLKGIPEKCKSYKKCRKEAKRRIYEACEQYKKVKTKKEDLSECCCLKISKFEEEKNDKIDKKCYKYNKKDKKSDNITLLECNCKKPDKTSQEDEETTESDEEGKSKKLVCKTKRERKIYEDYKKGKISKKCKKELLENEYKNNMESRWRKKTKAPCIKCDDANTNILRINTLKKDKINKSFEYVCDKTCIKYKKDGSKTSQEDSESASTLDSEKGKKAKKGKKAEKGKKAKKGKKPEKFKKRTKKDIECDKKRFIEEFERLEEEKRRLECDFDRQMEEYFKYDPVEEKPRYLLPSEYKKLSVEEKCKREGIVKEYLKKRPEPYRCVRTCIDPDTAKLRYQEYICYPPPPCVPEICQHPLISFPKDCKCDDCSENTCGSQVCKNIRHIKQKIKYEEPEKCDPITVCVPVTDGGPPIVCADCPLEIREKASDFHIVTFKNVKKHMKLMNKKLQKVIEDWEKQNQDRKSNVHRFP